MAVELRRGAEIVDRLATDASRSPVDFRTPLAVVGLGEPPSYAFYG